MEELLKVVARLRDKNSGCPWDIKQTHESLTSNLLEESYELLDAIDTKDFDNMREELGDILLQVLLHSQIASESEKFNFQDVATDLKNKLIRRHPHVFGEEFAGNADEALLKWKESKKKEGKVREDIDYHLALNPSLTAATNIGAKTNKIGFDWDTIAKVREVVIGEWQELEVELASNGNIEEELGDLLFSIAQLSRHLKIDPEAALKKSNLKFINRFKKMKKLIESKNLDLLKMTQTEMDHYWKQIKESTT